MKTKDKKVRKCTGELETPGEEKIAEQNEEMRKGECPNLQGDNWGRTRKTTN